MSNSGNGGCLISAVVWFIISAIITAITDSVGIGMLGGTIAMIIIIYQLTKD